MSRDFKLLLICCEVPPSTLYYDRAPSYCSGDGSPSCFCFFFRRLKLLVRPRLGPSFSVFAMLRHSVRKNILEAQEQFKSNYVLLFFYCAFLCFSSLRVDCTILSLFLDRKPGEVETITDLLMENWKNFPEARQLREDSARFIRQEMESTWGQQHLAVLSEDEAQCWILRVSIIYFYFGTKEAFSLSKITSRFLYQLP